MRNTSSMFFCFIENNKNSDILLYDKLYVMLMLQRSEGSSDASKTDCDDPIVALACQTDSDACPAECKEDSSKDDDGKVVKSGDLAVSAEAAEGRKALIDGVSDLDTLTFKTSEDVTISSITLERYGYSTIDDIQTVQLEDEDGNIIADAKEPNSKGQIKLTLKKDYKTVNGTYRATIVVKTRGLGKTAANAYANDVNPNGASIYSGEKNGSTIGFKVIAAESTAKNLNLDNYNPYTYDLVNYAGSKVQFSSRNSSTKEYSREAGEMYEVAKFRVKAPADAAILVKGFTLTDKETTKNVIEADKFAKEVKVTVDGKEVSGLKWNINKDDELVISFKEVEVAGKETATIAVSMSFNEEFDNLGTSKGRLQYYIADLSNFNAVDKKTETRVSEDEDYSISKLRTDGKWTLYTFKGGKVKLSGSKLGTVNAAANSTNVLVAQGEITITEPLRGDAEIAIKAGMTGVDEMRLVIAGEEYDGTRGTNKFTFKGLEIDKSGKIEVRIDVKDTATTTIEFDGSLNSSSFPTLKYDESGESATGNIIGSISLSNVRIQAAKASLENKLTKKVELVKGETNRKTIFDGTYTAKKGEVTLKNFVITATAALAITGTNNRMPTFYVTIDKEEYDADWGTWTEKVNGATVTRTGARGDIDDIVVADGKSVNVKVEIEVVPSDQSLSNTFNIALDGEDADNNKAGEANDDSVKVEAVNQGTLDVVDPSAKKTVLLKSDRSVAKFRVKPSKSSDDEIILKTLEFAWTGSVANAWSELKFDVDGDITEGSTVTNGVIKPEISVPAEGIVVNVTLKSEYPTAQKTTLTLSGINGKTVNSVFSKYYVPAKLKITQNNGKGKDTTTYTVEVENDTSLTVGTLNLYVNSGSECALSGGTLNKYCKSVASKDTLSEGSAEDNKLSATNKDSAASITAISYKVGSEDIIITKKEFENFFEKAYGDDDLMVYSNKS